MRWWRNLWNLKRRRLMSNIVWVILVGNVFGGRCGAEALGLGLMSLNPAYRLTLPPGLAKTNRCLAFDQGRLPDYYSTFITHCSLHFSSTHALSSNSICVISYLSLHICLAHFISHAQIAPSFCFEHQLHSLLHISHVFGFACFS